MTSGDDDLVQAIASATAGAQLVYLFGSAGSHAERPDSDVDIAVLFDEPLSADGRIELCGTIEKAIGRPVDLVDLATADPVIRRQIVAGGIVVRLTDPFVRARFEMKTLSEYLDLKIERRAAERRLVETWP